MRGKRYKKTRRKTTYISKGTGSKIINTGEGSIAKKRTSRNMQVRKNNRERLEKETRKLVNKTNARLSSLQRHSKKGTWASKTLANRLSGSLIKSWNKSTGKVKFNKNMTATQLIAINKALNQFLKSKTSTRKGIEEVKRKQIEKIKSRKELEEDTLISDEEAESLYNIFGDEDFNRLTDKIPSSALQAAVEEAIEENDTEDDFIKRLTWYSSVEMNDLDMRESAIKLYDKYVK